MWPFEWQSRHATPAAGAHRAPVLDLIELLLGERGQQQAQAVELFGVEDAVEQLEEVVEGDQLPLRDVAEVGARDQEDRGRELGQEVVGQVEVEVESLQVPLLVALDGVDVELGEQHPALGMIGVGQGQEAERERVTLPDQLRRHPAQRFPRDAGRQLRAHAGLDRLAVEHRGVARGAIRQVVALGQQPVVLLLQTGLGRGHALADGLERLLDHHRGEARLALRRRRRILARRVLRHGQAAPGQRRQQGRGERPDNARSHRHRSSFGGTKVPPLHSRRDVLPQRYPPRGAAASDRANVPQAIRNARATPDGGRPRGRRRCARRGAPRCR